MMDAYSMKKVNESLYKQARMMAKVKLDRRRPDVDVRVYPGHLSVYYGPEAGPHVVQRSYGPVPMETESLEHLYHAMRAAPLVSIRNYGDHTFYIDREAGLIRWRGETDNYKEALGFAQGYGAAYPDFEAAFGTEAEHKKRRHV